MDSCLYEEPGKGEKHNFLGMLMSRLSPSWEHHLDSNGTVYARSCTDIASELKKELAVRCIRSTHAHTFRIYTLLKKYLAALFYDPEASRGR
jgi:hypothetical protein